MKQLRRHNLADDPDWAGTLTLPVFVDGDTNTLSTGAIDTERPAKGALVFAAEFRADATDGAAPVAPGTATFTVQAIQYLGRDGGVYMSGAVKGGCTPQRRIIELDLETTTPVWLRVTDLANVPVGATALVFWVSDQVGVR